MANKSIPGSVSRWLANPHGNPAPTGADLLLKRFGARLTSLARRQLRQAKDPAYEAEDLALSTINAFYQAAVKNSLPLPPNRQQLWNMLAAISLNKSRNFRKSLNRRKRQATFSNNVSSLDESQTPQDCSSNSPEFIAMVADQCEFLLRLLDDQDPSGELKTIALMRLDGASKAQIAAATGYTRFTISARIHFIHAIWQHHLNQQEN